MYRERPASEKILIMIYPKENHSAFEKVGMVRPSFLDISLAGLSQRVLLSLALSPVRGLK
jgi:hypothetical protein